jgi:AbrB family looped-hinge helix DNA binding protein
VIDLPQGLKRIMMELKVNKEGRITIPSAYRKQLGMQSGQFVTFNVMHGGLLLMNRDKAIERFQDEVAALVGPRAGLVDELIADRKAEAADESGK